MNRRDEKAARNALGVRSAEPSSAARSTFSLGLWLRLHGVDLITMALMGAVGLGIYEARKLLSGPGVFIPSYLSFLQHPHLAEAFLCTILMVELHTPNSHTLYGKRLYRYG